MPTTPTKPAVAYTAQMGHTAAVRLATEQLIARRLAEVLDVASSPPLPKLLRKAAAQALAARAVADGIGVGPGADGLAASLEEHGVDADLAARVVEDLVADGRLGPAGKGIAGETRDAVLTGICNGAGLDR